MPFRDREWEDFLRDCDFFPAYTDYIFGVDMRPQVDDEPGLHPQMFDTRSLSQSLPQPLLQQPLSQPLQQQPLSQLAPQRLFVLPPPVQYPAAYDPTRSESHALTSSSSTYGSPTYGALTYSVPNHSMPALQRTSMLRQESSLESMQPTPTPAPRQLPTSAPLSHPYTQAIPGPSMLRQDSSMGASLQPTPSPAPYHLLTPGLQPNILSMPGPSRAPMMRQDFATGASQPQTAPLPRAQPATSTVELLRPGDIVNDPKYSVFPRDRRIQIDNALSEACIVFCESEDPQERANATALIKSLSIGAARKLDEIHKAAAAKRRT